MSSCWGGGVMLREEMSRELGRVKGQRFTVRALPGVRRDDTEEEEKR